ncbi:MAG: hypothetical protein JXP34_12060 [Planctomycetes bacterium]|nr:hypothetical protein [Planctomycetota bacterium]
MRMGRPAGAMLLCPLFFGSAPHAVVAAPRPELSEDFSILGPDWVPFLNYWRLNPSQWHHRTEGGFSGRCLAHDGSRGVEDPERGAHDALMIYGPGREWEDYRFTCRVKLDEGAAIGVWFRATYVPQKEAGRRVGGYILALDPAHDAIRLRRIRTEGKTAYHFSDPELMDAASATLERGRWYAVEVEAVGPDFRCTIDGRTGLLLSDDRFPSGSVGLMAYKARAALFDDVRVEPIDRAGGAIEGRVGPAGLPARAIARSAEGTEYTVSTRDPAGRFRIPFLPDGTYEVEAIALRAARIRCPEPIAISGGRTGEAPELVLPVGGLSGSVSPGRSKAAIALERDGIVWRRIDAEKDGSFRVPFIEAGAYRLRAFAEGFRPHVVDSIAIRSGTVMELPQIVLEAGGEP